MTCRNFPLPETRERTIVHLNVANFAVAVEELCDRRLMGRPVAVAVAAGSRTAVYDMSEEAYRSGVRKGMLLGEARRCCCGLLIVPPHPDCYERAMKELWEQIAPYSPLAERVDDQGHFFLDLTGTHRLFGPAPDVAWRIRKKIRREMGLDPIWSLAPNKLVAKVASRLVKPVGEYIVGGGEEAVFLAPRPLVLLPGLRRQDLLLLADLNITRIGELAALTLTELTVLFGLRARWVHDLAHGIDPAPVTSVRAAAARIVAEHHFPEDTNDRKEVEYVLRQLTEQIGRELRQQRVKTRHLELAAQYTDGVRVIRQAVANPATANDLDLFVLARLVLQRAWQRRLRLTHLRLIADRLGNPPVQLPLFTDEAEKQRLYRQNSLLKALDTIRCRFSAEGIKSGCLVAQQQIR